MKKVLALVLSITMVLSLSTPVFAVDAEKNVGETVVLSSCTEEIVGGDLYTLTTEKNLLLC